MTDLTFAVIILFTVVFLAVLCALAFWAIVIDRNRGLFGDALPKHVEDDRWGCSPSSSPPLPSSAS